MLTSVATLLPFLASAVAVTVQKFKAPADCPTCLGAPSAYTGKPNGSLPLQPVVPGAAYDRFVTIWLENTDYESAAASPTFQSLAKEGLLLTAYHGVTHPSEPNYVAATVGDFFGMADDDDWFLPYNVSTVVDLLESKNVSWATYQENMPADAWSRDWNQTNYLQGNGSYVFYKRKHNPYVIANSVAGHPERAMRIRNFDDFAVDVNASALPQHVFITPNMVNDGE
jgi:hypothetical protein